MFLAPVLEAWSGFRGAATRKAGAQDQNQAIKQKRHDQGRGVAQAQVCKKKFQSSEGDGGRGQASTVPPFAWPFDLSFWHDGRLTLFTIPCVDARSMLDCTPVS
jgi:hypothetical protein